MSDAHRPLVLATRNRKKLKELQEILADIPARLMTLDEFPDAPEVDETGTTFEENARLKAETVGRALNAWVLADDSGLEVDALGGAPGVYSARYSGAQATDQSNRTRLLQALADVPEGNRQARFRCVIALYAPAQAEDPQDPVTEGRTGASAGRVWFSSGRCEGRITFDEKGSGGFGYDPIFYVTACGKTMAELSAEEKHAVSHRGEALKGLREVLVGLFG